MKPRKFYQTFFAFTLANLPRKSSRIKGTFSNGLLIPIRVSSASFSDTADPGLSFTAVCVEYNLKV